MPRLPEEAPPVPPPIAPPVAEHQAASLCLSQNQPSRAEESLRQVEQQPHVDSPPEASKVPLHVPKSSCMLESLPMNHISTALTGGILLSIFNPLAFNYKEMPVCLTADLFFSLSLSCRRIGSSGDGDFSAAATTEAH